MFSSADLYAEEWQDAPFYSGRTPHTLSEYKGKVVLVFFWATWCPYCKKQIPAFSLLKNLYAKVPDVAFLNISTDSDGESVVKSYLDTYNLNNLDSYIDINSNLLHSFGITAIPTLILISRDGEVLGIYGGLQQFDVKYLDQLLKKNG